MQVKKLPISFYVFRKDGSKNPNIKTHFLEEMILDTHTALDKKIKLADDTIWELIMEEEVKQAFKISSSVRCIVSFQAHTQGNYAVARLFKENKRTKGKQ